jgi:hypothetical protein
MGFRLCQISWRGRGRETLIFGQAILLYNSVAMHIHTYRRFIGIIIILVSLLILLWGLWPFGRDILSVPILPQNMQLPTPQGYLGVWFL